jgi:integrase
VSLALIVDHVRPGITAAEFTPAMQRETMRRMQAAGYAYGTAKRAMGAAKAALRWAWKEGHLDRPVPFMELQDGPRRERVLDVAEMARLWSQDMPAHVRMFLALLIGTAARPEALLELTTWQCDVERRTINLNPPGRVQTRKRRPIVPMPDWLVLWIQAAPPGHLVQYRGKRVLKIAKAFRTLRAAAGFGADVTAYTLRHSVATELARRGVPPLEIAHILGHRMPDLRPTGRYIHVMPGHLAAAREALDALANEIGRAATRPILLSAVTTLRASCVLAPQPPGTTLAAKPWKTGAGKGTGERKSLGNRSRARAR